MMDEVEIRELSIGKFFCMYFIVNTANLHFIFHIASVCRDSFLNSSCIYLVSVVFAMDSDFLINRNQNMYQIAATEPYIKTTVLAYTNNALHFSSMGKCFIPLWQTSLHNRVLTKENKLDKQQGNLGEGTGRGVALP